MRARWKQPAAANSSACALLMCSYSMEVDCFLMEHVLEGHLHLQARALGASASRDSRSTIIMPSANVTQCDSDSMTLACTCLIRVCSLEANCSLFQQDLVGCLLLQARLPDAPATRDFRSTIIMPSANDAEFVADTAAPACSLLMCMYSLEVNHFLVPQAL